FVDRRGNGHDAVPPLPVLVFDVRIAARLQEAGHRRDEAGPVFAREAADGDRPVLAVILPVAIEIPFELAEIGKHGLPPPLGAAVFGPPAIIGGGAASGDKAVDARSAAEEPRLPVPRRAPGGRAGASVAVRGVRAVVRGVLPGHACREGEVGSLWNEGWAG